MEACNGLLFVSRDYPPVGGGQGRYVYELMQHMKDSLVLTTKVLHRENDDRLLELPYEGTGLIKFMIRSFFRFQKHICYKNIKIIHGNSIDHALFLLRKKKGIKYVTTAHNTYPQRLESKKNIWKFRLVYPFLIALEKRVLSRSDVVICVSPLTKKRVEKMTNNKNVIIVENGVDTKKFVQTNRKNQNQVYKFLYVGRLEVRKRVLETIQFFHERIQSTGTLHAELHILGTGPEESNIKKYVREQNLQNSVLIHGFQKDVEEFYKQSDCLVLLSTGEGLPLVVLEGIAAGLALITTHDATGYSEKVRSYAQCYINDDCLDVEQIKNAFTLAYENRNQTIKTHKDFITKLDWSYVAEQTFSSYSD